MISAQPWELTAALSVLELARQHAATLRDSMDDSQALDAAEHRCNQARRMVERIRATLSADINQHAEDAQAEFHG